MSLKDFWKDAGKSVGHSFADLGKGIAQSVSVGAERIADDEGSEAAKQTDLRKTWSAVGHSFGRAGKSFGKAVAETADRIADEDEPAETTPGEEEQP